MIYRGEPIRLKYQLPHPFLKWNGNKIHKMLKYKLRGTCLVVGLKKKKFIF